MSGACCSLSTHVPLWARLRVAKVVHALHSAHSPRRAWLAKRHIGVSSALRPRSKWAFATGYRIRKGTVRSRRAYPGDVGSVPLTIVASGTRSARLRSIERRIRPRKAHCCHHRSRILRKVAKWGNVWPWRSRRAVMTREAGTRPTRASSGVLTVCALRTGLRRTLSSLRVRDPV